MKHQYITPACRVISIRTRRLITISQNEYYNNEGHIHFSSDEIRAEEGD